MAKRGEQARETVKNTIIEAFKTSDSFVALQDKKIFVQAKDDNGEVLQFSISITMPKTPIEIGTSSSHEESHTATELSADDKRQVERLKQMLIEKGVYKE